MALIVRVVFTPTAVSAWFARHQYTGTDVIRARVAEEDINHEESKNNVRAKIALLNILAPIYIFVKRDKIINNPVTGIDNFII